MGQVASGFKPTAIGVNPISTKASPALPNPALTGENSLRKLYLTFTKSPMLFTVRRFS